MINRILFAYLGAIGLPLLLLPLAMIETMGGHSLMYVSLFSSPIGLIAAMAYSDKKRHFNHGETITRSALAVAVYILTFLLILLLSEINISSFLKNQGWILVVVLAPLLAALSTENVMAKKQISHNQ
jgi:hypothetical protein